MNEQEIKIYKDIYADASYAKVGFKGKTIGPSGNLLYLNLNIEQRNLVKKLQN